MKRALQIFLVLFGVVVIMISLAHLAVGHAAVMGGSPVNATSDGEDRFFAGIFLGFGAAVIWCARDVERKFVLISALSAICLVGGIGRLLSLLFVGTPHPFFIAMLVVEFVVPAILVAWAHHVAEPPGVAETRGVSTQAR